MHQSRSPRRAAALALVLLVGLGSEAVGSGADWTAVSSPSFPAWADATKLAVADKAAADAILALAAPVPVTAATVDPTTTSAVPVVAPAPAAAAAGPPALAPRRGAIPVGVGMWIWLPERAEAGDVNAIVSRAVGSGLTHIYVRTGSSRQGFVGGPFLDALLPAAHAAGLRVYGWDFPYLEDVNADVARSMQAITYLTPGGHRIDGFVPDIETASEGTNLTVETAVGYSANLRAAAGPGYPLVVCVPRPSDHAIAVYPYGAIAPYYDAIAPMVYWLNRQPDSDVDAAVRWLSQFGKPVIPVGQAYDGGPEGGRPGPPPGDEIHRFLIAAQNSGAAGASFWSWQHASAETWQTLASTAELDVTLNAPTLWGQTQSIQQALNSLGYPVPVTAIWDAGTITQLAAFQRDVGQNPSGLLDAPTLGKLLGPLAPPVGAR